MVMAGSQPALVHAKTFNSGLADGQDVIFVRRKDDGTWTPGQTVFNIANTQSGGSLAWDSQIGYGIAAVDRGLNALLFSSSMDGETWTTADPIYQSGSGGWYPSLAFDPIHHEPAVAYYNCSPRGGVNESSCQPSEDELWVSQRIGENWRSYLVDPEGGYLPKLAFLSSSKRVIAYRDPSTGVLKLAVER